MGSYSSYRNRSTNVKLKKPFRRSEIFGEIQTTQLNNYPGALQIAFSYELQQLTVPTRSVTVMDKVQ